MLAGSVVRGGVDEKRLELIQDLPMCGTEEEGRLRPDLYIGFCPKGGVEI